MTADMMKVDQMQGSEKNQYFEECSEHFLPEILKFLGNNQVVQLFLRLGKVL